MADYIGFANLVTSRPSIRESFLAGQQQAAQEQLLRQRQKVMSDLISNPNPTAKDILNASMYMDKDAAESLRKSFEVMGSEKQSSALNLAGQVMSAFEMGKPEVASDLLKSRAEAARNSGDEQNAKFYDVMAQNAIENPHAAKLTIGMMTAHIPGGDKVMEAVGKRGEELRKQELQPGEVKKQEGELLQQAAQLGLTKEQTNEIMVRTKNLRREGKKIMLELEALRSGGGIIPPKDRIDAEQKLRKEYNDQTSNFQAVRESFGRIQSSEETPAGDIALIFNYMKMLDPGSVVREGEFATAQNAGGIDDRIINAYNKALTGERLNPAQRKQFQSQAGKLYKTAQNREEEVRKGMTGMVKRYGLDERNIFYQGNVEPQAPKPAQPQDGLPPGWGVTVR